MRITANSGNYKKTTLPASLETCMQVKKQQLEPDMKPDWFKTEKRVHQGCILPPCLTSIQSTSCEMLAWMNHKLESRFLEEIVTTSDMQMIPL